MTALGDVGPGHTLGRYELLVPIAQGGMAVVWAARLKGTRGFQKIVAVKSMLPALSEDPQFEEMFLAEAELASRIRHPHVCEILDLGEEKGVLYIVMEWVDGEPLSTLQKAARSRGGVPLPVATRLAMSAALGLHAAHELRSEAGDLLGLVHRDVSPQNILVTYEGIVKIVDFGVAKATESDGSKTRAGQVKGKVPFMSPEQAHGKAVDRRTDIFALGIVLYQMATGKHPFRGENDMATLHRITDKEPVPPPSTINTTIPPALDGAICHALEKDPAKRFQTMLEMAKALERALGDLGSHGHEDEVAAFVREALGERAEKRRNAIKDALRLADVRTVARKLGDVSGGIAPINAKLDDDLGRSSLVSSSPRSASPSVPTAPESKAIQTPSSATFVTESGAPAVPSRRRAMVLAGAALAAAVAGGSLLLFRGKGGAAAPEPAAQPTMGVPAAAASAAEPTRPASVPIPVESSQPAPDAASAAPPASASAVAAAPGAPSAQAAGSGQPAPHGGAPSGAFPAAARGVSAGSAAPSAGAAAASAAASAKPKASAAAPPPGGGDIPKVRDPGF